MSGERFWIERVVERLNADVGRALPHMLSRVQPPPPRPRPLREQVQYAIADPASVDWTGRKYMMERLREKYGDMADMVAPYIIPEPEPEVEEAPDGWTNTAPV